MGASRRCMATATTPSCLTLQDVRGQGLQLGRPVYGGRCRAQDELREPRRQPLVDPCVQSRATLGHEVRGVEVWTTTLQPFNRRRRQWTAAIGEVDAEVLGIDTAP